MKKVKWIIAFESAEDRVVAQVIFKNNHVPLDSQFIDPVFPNFWEHVEQRDKPTGEWDATIAINLVTKEVRLFTR